MVTGNEVNEYARLRWGYKPAIGDTQREAEIMDIVRRELEIDRIMGLLYALWRLHPDKRLSDILRLSKPITDADTGEFLFPEGKTSNDVEIVVSIADANWERLFAGNMVVALQARFPSKAIDHLRFIGLGGSVAEDSPSVGHTAVEELRG